MSGEASQNSKRMLPQFAEIDVCLKQCMEHVSKMQQNSDNHGSMKDGISLLDLKNQMLLLYELNLAALLQCKLTGKSLQQEGKEIVRRLARLRPVLERIRALEHRLQYRIDKLLKAASQAGPSAEGRDPLSFRPQPDGMFGGDENEDNSELESNDDSAANEKNATGKSAKYVPPKLRAMYYNEDKEVEKTEISKRAKLRASVVAELQQEFSHAPDEERDADAGQRYRRQLQKASEQRDYEEANFVRLAAPKRNRRNTAQGNLQDLLDFDQNDYRPSSSKRNRTSGKSKSKKMHRKRPAKKF